MNSKRQNNSTSSTNNLWPLIMKVKEKQQFLLSLQVIKEYKKNWSRTSRAVGVQNHYSRVPESLQYRLEYHTDILISVWQTTLHRSEITKMRFEKTRNTGVAQVILSANAENQFRASIHLLLTDKERCAVLSQYLFKKPTTSSENRHKVCTKLGVPCSMKFVQIGGSEHLPHRKNLLHFALRKS